MNPLTGDLAYFIQLMEGNQSGIIVIFVDNTISTDDYKFEKKRRPTERTLESKQKSMNLSFLQVFKYKKVEDTFLLNQATYASKLELLNMAFTIEKYRGSQQEIEWLTKTRRDLVQQSRYY